MKYKAMQTICVGLISAALANTSNATSFNVSEVEVEFLSQFSIGSSFGMSNPDKRFIHTSSGGVGTSRTSDDGRRNYDKGDVYSTQFKGVHELQLKYENSGAFFRGKYWYDFTVKDGSPGFYDIDDSGRKPLQKGGGVYLLDAFVYQDYNLGENPGSVRLGRQVVSWGESTFIQNSINAVNPVDVAGLRRPGSEVKESLLPVEMLYVSQGIGDDLGLEAFYQLKWAPSVLDNCGTFFGSDPLATGCVDRLVLNGNDYPQGDSRLDSGWPLNPSFVNYSVRARKDKEAKDSGQYGLAVRKVLSELNNTEVGFYFINYHSRSPIVSYLSGPGLAAGRGAPGVRGLDGVVGPSGYFVEYPENIRLYGMSFQTSLDTASWAGEISYRPNMPIQVNSADLGRTAIAFGQDNTYRDLVGLPTGSYIKGFERKDFWQVQTTFTQIFDQVLGASRLSLVAEAGVNYIGGLSDQGGTTQYGRDSVFGQSMNASGGCATQVPLASPKANSWCENDGFYTSLSYGYRARAVLDYNDVFYGVNLSPDLSFSHDVHGYGPNFTEDAKAISVGLTADFLSRYQAYVSYTNYFDGKYNNLVDRDFASVGFSASF